MTIHSIKLNLYYCLRHDNSNSNKKKTMNQNLKADEDFFVSLFFLTLKLL